MVERLGQALFARRPHDARIALGPSTRLAEPARSSRAFVVLVVLIEAVV